IPRAVPVAVQLAAFRVALDAADGRPHPAGQSPRPRRLGVPRMTCWGTSVMWSVFPARKFVLLLILGGLGLLAAGLWVRSPDDEDTFPLVEEPAPAIHHDDPLPPGAIARIGTVRLQHGAAVSRLTFSPDGKTLASIGGYSSVVHLWDVATGKEIRRFNDP